MSTPVPVAASAEPVTRITRTRTRARPLSPRMHAASDVILLSSGLIAPFALGYAGGGLPALYTFAVVGSGVVLNVFTDYPLGLLRTVPMRVHRLIELTGPGLFVVLPWFLFPGPAAWVLTVIGALNFATAALTEA